MMYIRQYASVNGYVSHQKFSHKHSPPTDMKMQTILLQGLFTPDDEKPFTVPVGKPPAANRVKSIMWNKLELESIKTTNYAALKRDEGRTVVAVIVYFEQQTSGEWGSTIRGGITDLCIKDRAMFWVCRRKTIRTGSQHQTLYFADRLSL